MAKKRDRRSGLDRERDRRRQLDRARASVTSEAAAAIVGKHAEETAQAPAAQAETAATFGSTAPDAAGRATTGARLPGQNLDCVWCGAPIELKARGPVPKFCSTTCRHRAWELDRAARSGRAATVTVERFVTASPEDTDGWVAQLDQLARQIRRGHLETSALIGALDAVYAAVEARERWRSPGSQCR